MTRYATEPVHRSRPPRLSAAQTPRPRAAHRGGPRLTGVDADGAAAPTSACGGRQAAVGRRLTRLALGAAIALGLGPPAAARASIPQPIYFWGSVAATLRAPGQTPEPEVIRPSTIFLFADGSWDIDHLRWRNWGSSIAKATGISSASNGIPDQAQGRRIKTRASITLSSPGRFFGREVYRCFRLTVPRPATDLHACLAGTHGYWNLG